MAASKTVIRRYGNGRLYDTAASRYVNLEDIARIIRSGGEVQVVDARTGEDFTRLVLTQIIVEDARRPEPALPLRLLRQLIIASDRATHDFLSWYLETAADLYQRAGATVRSLISGPSKPPALDPEIEALRQRVQDLESRLAKRKSSRPRRRRKADSAK